MSFLLTQASRANRDREGTDAAFIQLRKCNELFDQAHASWVSSYADFYASQKKYDVAVEAGKHALRESENHGWQHSVSAAQISYALGSVYFEEGRYKEAEQNYLNALRIYKPNDSRRIETLISLARAYRSMGQASKASEILREKSKLAARVSPRPRD